MSQSAPNSRPSSATPSDDSSIISELSFDYTLDDEGNPVRLKKSQPTFKYINTSTPPTPQDSDNEQPHEPSPPTHSPLPLPSQTKKLPSPVLSVSEERPLSRSESAYAVLNGAQSSSSARPFKRIGSGSLSTTPGGTGSTHIASGPSAGVRARRLALDEQREQDARNRIQIDEIRSRAIEDVHEQDEEENLVNVDSVPDKRLSRSAVAAGKKRHSPPFSRVAPGSQRAASGLAPRSASYSGLNAARPLADAPLPQRDHRGRILKQKYGVAISTGFDRISESEDIDGEHAAEYLTGDDTDPGTSHLHNVSRQMPQT
jgi:serine/threonine-protein kinase TTK/MPS1